ncbi:hypothetical protein [Virgibacillus proomii]|uniref:hypothetical protein n=1 Tax=Virgibacillus proomii TaxID=84407 RepID=UPI000987CE37|nr:hypothetical protein [Virgibacillus proomii]
MIEELDHEAGRAAQQPIKKEEKTQSQKLIELTSDMTLFYDDQGESYAKMKVDNHYEVWNVESETMELMLIDRYMNAYENKIPSKKGLKEAVQVLKAKARLRGKKEVIHTRIAETDDAAYIDLCNGNWEVIEIKKEGWKVISSPPVYFKRSKTMKTLPKPNRNGKIDHLKPFVNFSDKSDFKLIIAWLLSTLKENSPFPILILQGEQGSAKSTTANILRSIIDPSSLPLRTFPNDEMTLAIASSNTWILAYDNLSGLSNKMSDALCKMSTGGGITTRTLYTTNEETVLKIKRPCILNGIDDIGQRPDLLERSIVLTLPSIKAEKRTDEKTFWKDFKDQHANILGALCDVVSGTLRELPYTKLKSKPRMADFALWITAAEKSLDWESDSFIEIYKANMSKAIDLGLELDPIAVAVQELMSERNEWIATTTETLNQLKSHAEKEVIISPSWPTPNKLKDRLRRIAPSLRTKGIEYVELPRSSKGGMIKINKF